MLNNAFFSIVKNRNKENELLVRARIRGDIEKVFPKANTFEDKDADYRYRSFIKTSIVVDKISDEIFKIDYDNFKNSISKDDISRTFAYGNVWKELYKLHQSKFTTGRNFCEIDQEIC